MAENKDCKLNGSNLCKFMGCDGCDRCVFQDGVGKGMDAETIAERWDVTLSYLPEEIDALHDTDTCVFCGEAPKECYAELSLGHPEPEYKKGMFLGLGKKVRAEIGSLIDPPIACCKACKRKIMLQDVLQYVIVALVFVLGIVIMSIPAISELLEKTVFIVPIALLAAFFGLGCLVANIVLNAYIKKQEKTVIMNALEIPTVKKLIALGWFPIPDSKNNRPHLHFSKRKVRENFRYFSK